MSVKDIIGFCLGSVLLSHVVAPMLGNFIQKTLVKTEKDAILWMHYQRKAKRRGHKAKYVEYCNDGHCIKVTV